MSGLTDEHEAQWAEALAEGEADQPEGEECRAGVMVMAAFWHPADPDSAADAVLAAIKDAGAISGSGAVVTFHPADAPPARELARFNLQDAAS